MTSTSSSGRKYVGMLFIGCPDHLGELGPETAKLKCSYGFGSAECDMDDLSELGPEMARAMQGRRCCGRRGSG